MTFTFVGETKTLTIDAHNKYLPYYPESEGYPPRGANWVGVAIPVPAEVDTDEVTATINGKSCVNLYFALNQYMEYIAVEAEHLQGGAASYEWVINWGAGYAPETIHIEFVNVGGLQAPVARDADSVTQDPGIPVVLEFGLTPSPFLPTNTLTISNGLVEVLRRR